MALPLTTPFDVIPSQMLKYSEKIKDKKKWGRTCVDAFEQLGIRQYYDNLRFVENYQMLNGKFMLHHYIDQEGYKDMISQLTMDFDVPSTLRHYDIIGKVIKHLTEKLSEFPDIFRVEEFFEEDQTNEYVRTMSELMHKTVQANINNEIMTRLIQEGVDPNKQDFKTEEEAQQYRQEIQQMVQALTPPEIQQYMETEWQSQGEIWANHQLIVNRQRNNLDSLERKEFKDMLITDRCMRHFFLTPTGRSEETWNPLNTFFHMSPDIDWIEDGDYVGRIFYYTKSDILKRYGWRMTTKDMKALETIDKEIPNNLDFNGYPYKQYAPFADHKAWDIVTRGMGYDPINKLPMLGADTLSTITNSLPTVNTNAGFFRVTEVYWQSQQLLGKYVHIDPFTGVLVEDLVDEHFVVPEHVTEITGDYYEGHELDTVYWTWVDQTWSGTKICFATNDEDAIYLDIEPCEFQFRGDDNIYCSKLPVCGRIFNNRNAQSMSLVDMMKPHQIGYNLCMNQGYQLLEKEIGKFMVWDVKFFNTLKDWGGEETWDKVALLAKELGHVFGDTSPTNMNGANPGGQLPKMIDMELTAQIMSRMKLATFFEERCLSQVGISQQSMAEVETTDSATGIKTAVEQTSINIKSYYTDFFEYKQHCLDMSLQIDQFVQSKKKDITISYTTSDQSRVFIQLFGMDLLLKEIHSYVVNSQQLLKQLTEIKQVFMQNNTLNANALDVIEVITTNSPSKIKSKIKASLDAASKKEQALQQSEQQQFQAKLEQDQEKENRVDERAKEANETKVTVAQILASKGKDSSGPTQQPTDNSLEYNKFNAKTMADQQKADNQRQSNEIQMEKVTNDKLFKAKQLEIQNRKLNSEDKRTKAQVRVAKVKSKQKK